MSEKTSSNSMLVPGSLAGATSTVNSDAHNSVAVSLPSGSLQHMHFKTIDGGNQVYSSPNVVSSDSNNEDSTNGTSMFALPVQAQLQPQSTAGHQANNASHKSAQTQPLLGNDKKKKPFLNKPVVLKILGAIMAAIFIISALVLGTLYECNIFAVSSMDSNQTTLALLGDYVQLPYDVKLGLYSYTILFTVPKLNQTHPVDIYSIRCDTMFDKIIQLENIIPNSCAPNETTNFDTCSEYNGKCILDEFIYQAKSPVTEINFYISISNFTNGLTKIKILGYDNYEEFSDFLENNVKGNPVKDVEMDRQNYLLVFDNDQMKESSYLFFVIQDVKGTTESFRATRLGLHAYYNASGILEPYCTMNSTNDFTCRIFNIDNNDYCFIGSVRSERDIMATGKKPPEASKMFHISYKLDKPISTTKGRGIVWGLISTTIIVVSTSCILCLAIRRKRRQR